MAKFSIAKAKRHVPYHRRLLNGALTLAFGLVYPFFIVGAGLLVALLLGLIAILFPIAALVGAVGCFTGYLDLVSDKPDKPELVAGFVPAKAEPEIYPQLEDMYLRNGDFLQQIMPLPDFCKLKIAINKKYVNMAKDNLDNG